ncbi:MAG: hypothetical protein QXU32_11265 [Nitrososphaerales archaeon]
MTVERVGITDVRRNVKYGLIAGHIASWAILGLIFAVDLLLRLEAGTFYSVIGLILGTSITGAIWVGFALHLITGTVIGLLFGYITTVVGPFRNTSAPKKFGLAIITGIVSWAVLFLPITFFAVQPALPEIASMLNQPRLLDVSSQILAGSIGMHVIYGGILGFMYYLATLPSPRDYEV